MDRKEDAKQRQKHVISLLMAGSSLILNDKQTNILILNQPHFSKTFDMLSLSSLMRSQRLSFQPDDNIVPCPSHSLANNNNYTELIPGLCSNRALQVSNERPLKLSVKTDKDLSDDQFVLSTFPLNHNFIPGSNKMCDDVNVNKNSKEDSCETTADVYSKQNLDALKEAAVVKSKTERCYAAFKQAMEGTGELSTTFNMSTLRNHVSASHDHDSIVPNCDEIMRGSCDIIKKNVPDQLCNCEEIPVVPDALNCKGLQVNKCMDTFYQDSTVAGAPSFSPLDESYCFTSCFAIEKESLADEGSDYELKLSPTQESYTQQQHDHIEDMSKSCTSHVSDDRDVTACTAKSTNTVDIMNSIPPDCGLLVDDGGATLLQDLPLETAKQMDMEILQVCNRTEYSIDNTDDDFNGISGKMEDATNSEEPNQQLENITNNLFSNTSRIDPGKSFPVEQSDNDKSDNSSFQVVPSVNQSVDDVDYNGPSRLLMAMEFLGENKMHSSPRFSSTWERMLLSGCYYDGSRNLNYSTINCDDSSVVIGTISTTKLNLARPKLRLGLSRRQRYKPLHPYYRAGTQ